MMKLDTSQTVAPAPLSAERAPRLLTQLADAIRIRHYSIRTEEAYVYWVKAFILKTAVARSWRSLKASIGAGFKAFFGTARQFQMDDPLPKKIAFNFKQLANLWRSNCRF